MALKHGRHANRQSHATMWWCWDGHHMVTLEYADIQTYMTQPPHGSSGTRQGVQSYIPRPLSDGPGHSTGIDRCASTVGGMVLVHGRHMNRCVCTTLGRGMHTKRSLCHHIVGLDHGRHMNKSAHRHLSLLGLIRHSNRHEHFST